MTQENNRDLQLGDEEIDKPSDDLNVDKVVVTLDSSQPFRKTVELANDTMASVVGPIVELGNGTTHRVTGPKTNVIIDGDTTFGLPSYDSGLDEK